MWEDGLDLVADKDIFYETGDKTALSSTLIAAEAYAD